jgi:hypothetical protein
MARELDRVKPEVFTQPPEGLLVYSWVQRRRWPGWRQHSDPVTGSHAGRIDEPPSLNWTRGLTRHRKSQPVGDPEPLRRHGSGTQKQTHAEPTMTSSEPSAHLVRQPDAPSQQRPRYFVPNTARREPPRCQYLKEDRRHSLSETCTRIGPTQANRLLRGFATKALSTAG